MVIFITIIKRKITKKLTEAVSYSPAVMLIGARQTGKSTLIQHFIETIYPARYFSFDELSVLSAAKSDPEGFIEGLTEPVAIDEVQRVPEVLLPIKRRIDKQRRSGQFILSGSANVLVLPQISESLAGRMEILTLWPFSVGELDATKETFIDVVFSNKMSLPKIKRESRDDIKKSILTGGFPEVQHRPTLQRKAAWFNSYITTILQRDIRDISQIEGITDIPRLLSLLSSRIGTNLNYADISKETTIPQSTLKRYIALLTGLFFIYLLPPWSANIGKRFVKSPKLYLIDTGLISHLLGLEKNKLTQELHLFGRLMENFVVMELVKQSSWCNSMPSMYFFRTHTGHEVDIILEDRIGNLVGIEVKSTSTLSSDDFKGLQYVAEAMGSKFKRGIVLYMGESVIPFGKRFYAVPLSALLS